ncbi:hypothetical protein ACIOGZ_29445 [Kitasatospora sp. NPDC088160]|uniref:hypothetical protein n=1 Tax=Kitasatospora sp. NPDC088160 TaxID=3364072 RepID=UPI00380391E2
MHPIGPIARRFPLVARVRPACLPLKARVGRLQQLADTASRQTDPGLTSTVFNQAALIASDVGLSDYARELCHRHTALYLTRGPLPAMSAIRGLEPLVNLARLNIRAGQHQQGHQLLLDLYQAITSATETVLDGITVPAQLTETDEQRAEVRAWLWRVVIADGTRALTCSARYSATSVGTCRGSGMNRPRNRTVIAKALGYHDKTATRLVTQAGGTRSHTR